MAMSQFDSAGTRLASLGADGVLTVWTHVPGNPAVLSHKFSTSSHLSAAPSCLLWPASDSGGCDQDLIALGTEAGHVHVYSSSESRLVASRKVCGRVLSLAWGRDNSLYVGSEAGTVARLRVAAAEAEAEVLALPSLHTPVHCLAVRGSTLAAASRTIVVWDLATEAVIKTLTGHSSPVTSLHFDPAGSVLLSSCGHERVVSVWNLVKKKKTHAVANLVVNDTISHVDVSTAAAEYEETETLVSVTSARGKLAVFKLNPRHCSGTVQPSVSVSFSTPEGGSLEIVTSRLVSASGLVSVCYRDTAASGLAQQLEQLQLARLEAGTKLVRQPRRPERDTGAEPELVTPNTDGKVVFLAPGPSLSVAPAASRKRQADKQNENSLPVEERLSLLSTTGSSSATSPRTDALTQLLVQGLHSSDARILDSVLDRADITLIDNTVRRLPAEAVLPLVTVLQRYIRGRGRAVASHAKWLKSVLTIHTGSDTVTEDLPVMSACCRFLVSVPECQNILSPVYALLVARTQNYSQVLQLRGKLDMVMKQNENKQTDNNLDIEQEPLAVFNDTSSDESDDMMSDLMINDNDALDVDDEDGTEDDEDDSGDNDEDMQSESD